MKSRKVTKRAIKDNLKALRHFIDTSKETDATRIAYAVECGIRWATEAHTWKRGPQSQVNMVKENTIVLRSHKHG